MRHPGALVPRVTVEQKAQFKKRKTLRKKVSLQDVTAHLLTKEWPKKVHNSWAPEYKEALWTHFEPLIITVEYVYVVHCGKVSI